MASSAGDGPQQETTPAARFRAKLLSLLCEDRDFGELEKFMADPDEHPRLVWLNYLLSCPSKHKPVSNPRLPEVGSLALSRLIAYFPDVIQRELLCDVFDRIKSGREERGYGFGALHGAVMCGRREIVQLLRDHGTNAELVGKAICRPLREYRDSERTWTPGDFFNSIKRAVLWSYLPNPIEYETVVDFLKKFEEARDITNKEKLSALIKGIVSQTPIAIIRLWVVILAWASVAPGQGHISDEFRKCQDLLYKKIVEELKSPLSSFFSDPSKTTVTGMVPDDIKKIRVKKVEEIVKIVIERKDVEGTNISQTAHVDIFMPGFIQVCSMYDLTFSISESDLPSLTPPNSLPPVTPPSNKRHCGRTAMHLAAALGDNEVLSALIKSYDSVLKKFPEGCGPIQRTDNFLRESFSDSFGMTPLHHAVLGNHQLVVRTLIQWEFFSPHVNVSDNYERTAFQIACSNKERATIVNELLLCKELDANTTNGCGFTPLHWAVYVRATEVVRVLVEGKTKAIRFMAKSAEGQHPHRLADDLKDSVAKKDIQDLLQCIPEVKDGVERLYRDRQVYVDAANAILVGAALIASVTYGGWLQPPFGNDSESTHPKVRVFWAFNSLSFFFAIATVMAGAAAVLPVADVYIEDAVKSIRRWLVGTAVVLICSIGFVLGAFAAAGLASLSQSPEVPHLKVNMISTTVIGSALCGTLGIMFCLRLFRIRRIQLIEVKETLGKWLNLARFTCLHIFKCIGDLCCTLLGESYTTRNSAPLESVPNATHKHKDYSILVEDLKKDLVGNLLLQAGDQMCLYVRCYQILESKSKNVSLLPLEVEGELNTVFLPEKEKKDFWDEIVKNVTEPHASFLFTDKSGEFPSPSANQSLENNGEGTVWQNMFQTAARPQQNASFLFSGESGQPPGAVQSPDTAGVVNMDMRNDLLRRRLGEENRRLEDELSVDYEGSQGGPSSPLPRITVCPADVIQLNESVWQLYGPSTAPEVEIIFFHGFQLAKNEDAFWNTWLSLDGSVIWPKAWLSKRFPRARILSISYDARITPGESHQADVPVTIENLIHDIVLDGNLGLGQNCPVVLVGHNLGGLIINKLVVQCDIMKNQSDLRAAYNRNRERNLTIERFLGNCRGVFYYSTPFAGSRAFDLFNQQAAGKSWTGISKSLINFLITLSPETPRLNDEFRRVRNNLQIQTFAVVESLKTSIFSKDVLVVEEQSARPEVDNFYTVRGADHFSICRPQSITSPSFTQLVRCIGQFVRVSLEGEYQWI